MSEKYNDLTIATTYRSSFSDVVLTLGAAGVMLFLLLPVLR
jgi:hypothetical protein